MKDYCERATIVHNKPCLDEKDALAAYEAVLSGWVAYGEISGRLETKLSQYITGQSDAAVVCSSGTASLYMALQALNIKYRDEVIIPDYVCTALLNAILMIGARAVPVDIDSNNLSLTAKIIEKHITARTQAIIAVHSYGIPCELDEIIGLGLPVIEDCAQGLGSRFDDGSPIGSKGDLSVFSFYATKTIAGGYGGALVSKKDRHIDTIRNYIDFDSPEVYQPRFNFMLSDINAAVALSQFSKLETFLRRRKEISQRYAAAIGNATYQNAFFRSDRINHFRYLVYLPTESDLIDLRGHLADNGIDSIIPLESRELQHNYLRLDRSLFPVAEEASKTILSLPIYPCLSEIEVERIVGCLGDWKFA